jgi:hypothetical protein
LKMKDLLQALFLSAPGIPTLQKNERIAGSGASQIRLRLLLLRAHPLCVILLRNSYALLA